MAELFRHTEGAPCCLLVFRYEPQTFSSLWRSASLESSYHNGTCGSFLSACMPQTSMALRTLFRTRITECYSDRVETGPDFVPGLPHAVAHFRRRAWICAPRQVRSAKQCLSEWRQRMVPCSFVGRAASSARAKLACLRVSWRTRYRWWTRCSLSYEESTVNR